MLGAGGRRFLRPAVASAASRNRHGQAQARFSHAAPLIERRRHPRHRQLAEETECDPVDRQAVSIATEPSVIMIRSCGQVGAP